MTVTASSPARQHRGRRRPVALLRRVSPPTLVVLVAATGYGAYLLWLGRDAWFWGDDWHFLLHRGTVPGEGVGLMEPFNGHWSILMALVYRSLFAVVGMTTYLPYLAVLVLLHLGIAVTAHLLFGRAGCDPWVSAVAALLLMFTGVAPEMVVFDAAMNHSGSILSGLLALHALVRHGTTRPGQATAWLFLLAAVMWSGTGVSVVVMAGVFAAARSGVRAGLRTISVPAVVLGAWYLGWGRHAPGGPDLAWSVVSEVPVYVWTGLTKVFGQAAGMPELGPVVLIVLVVNLITDRGAPTVLRHLAWAGFAAASAQLVLVALTRLQVGVDSAASGRYAYFTLVLLSPATAMALARLWRAALEPRWLPAAATVVLLVGYAVHGVGQVRQFAAGYQGVSRQWQDRLLGMVASDDAGQAMLTRTYDDLVNHGLSQELVASEEVRRALPDREATPQGRMEAETMFNIGVREESFDLFSPAFVDLTHGWTREIRSGPGCATYTAVVPDPMLQVATQEGTEIGVTSEATQVTTRLRRGDVTTGGRIWQVEPGPVYIASTAKDAVLQVSFDTAGDYTICKQ